MTDFNEEDVLKINPRSYSAIHTVVFLFVFLGTLLIPSVGMIDGPTDLMQDFPGKAKLINIYTESRLAIGDRVFNRNIVGTDHWINLTDGYAITGYQNATPLSEKELDSIQESLEKFRNYTESQGGVFLFVVPPDKQTIYPEKVPDEIQKHNGPSRLDQLIARLTRSDPNFPVLDLRPTLLEAKKTYPVYYATDTHWTPIGAYFAYRDIINALKPGFPTLAPHPISDYEISYHDPILFNVNRIIGSTSLAETSISLVPLFEVQAKEFYIDLPVQNNAAQLYFSNIGNVNAPTALIFVDSFFTSLRPFVSEHFSQAVYVHHLAIADGDYQKWLDQFKHDIVIFELTERNVGAISSLSQK